jgi:membrane-associated HD superfamily phosphohydrolase
MRLSFFRFLARRFNWFRPTTRFLVGFLTLALLTTLLLARTRSLLPAAESYREGDIVSADVIAPADITAEDVGETERRREAARRRTPSVWNHDPTVAERAAQSFRASWSALKQQADARADNSNHNAGANVNADAQAARPELAWPGEGDDKQAVARAVAARNFDAGALDFITRAIRETGSLYIFDDREAEHVSGDMRVVDTRGGTQTAVNQFQERFVALAAARESLRERILKMTHWKVAEREAVASAATPLLKTNVA